LILPRPCHITLSPISRPMVASTQLAGPAPRRAGSAKPSTLSGELNNCPILGTPLARPGAGVCSKTQGNILTGTKPAADLSAEGNAGPGAICGDLHGAAPPARASRLTSGDMARMRRQTYVAGGCVDPGHLLRRLLSRRTVIPVFWRLGWASLGTIQILSKHPVPRLSTSDDTAPHRRSAPTSPASRCVQMPPDQSVGRCTCRAPLRIAHT